MASKCNFFFLFFFTPEDTACLIGRTHIILRRTTGDIITSRGYKISALQVEHALCQHTSIAAISIVGVPDPTDGEKVGAVVASNENLTLEEIREWGKDKPAEHWLPPY